MVWDSEYFHRHIKAAKMSNQGFKTSLLEIPVNLLGVDTVPVIFGVGIKITSGGMRINTTSEKKSFGGEETSHENYSNQI